jgi:benzoylformate decarboxylase
VIGAEVFRYYPYVPGDFLPAGTELLQITANPEVAAAARVGDSLLGDPRSAIDQLLDLVAEGSGADRPEPMARPRLLPQVPSYPLTRRRSTPC